MDATSNRSERLTLKIDGMSCGRCVQAVTKALAAVPGVNVRSVAVGSAQIEASASDTPGVLIALDQAGYPATVAGRPADSVTPSRSGGCGCGPKSCCG